MIQSSLVGTWNPFICICGLLSGIFPIRTRFYSMCWFLKYW